MSEFQDINLFWSPVFTQNSLPFLIGSDKTGWYHMAGSNLTLLSSYYTDHSGLSSCLSLDEVNCLCTLCTETLLQSLDVFCASRKLLYIIKNKVSVFSSFLGLFYMFIISPPPQVPQPFVELGFQYSPLPFLPVSSQFSWNQTAFYISN